MVATPGATASLLAASPVVHWLSISYLLGALLVLGFVVAPLAYMFLRCVTACIHACGRGMWLCCVWCACRRACRGLEIDWTAAGA